MVYPGKLLWAIPYQQVKTPPPFLDATDGAYILWSPLEDVKVKRLDLDFAHWLDYTAWPFQVLLGKPVILAITFPSDPTLKTQFEAYEALLSVANQRDWISGFVSRGFYPPAALQDQSASVHGKPAAALLAEWFPLILGTDQ